MMCIIQAKHNVDAKYACDTTNLSCMTGGKTTGEQKLNGKPKTKATLARVMGYVEQNDIHTPALTVVESLEFSAHLRLDRDVNKRSEKNFVDNVRPSQSTLLEMCMSAERSNAALFFAWMQLVHAKAYQAAQLQVCVGFLMHKVVLQYIYTFIHFDMRVHLIKV